MSDWDRRTILERRALFLGSALATLGGCGRQSPAAEPQPPHVLSIPATNDEAHAAVDAPDAASPPRSPVSDGDMPPLDIPSGVSERARENYEALANRMTNAYGILTKMERSIPNCSITSCEDKWRALAEKHISLDAGFRFAYTCPGNSADAKAYREREKAQMDYYAARRLRVEEAIYSALDAGGNTRYEQIRAEIQSANPAPCLSFACSDW